jgi:DNA modification methylase
MIDLRLGDCLEIMKSIPDKSIDLVLTDIPYNGVNRESNGLRNLDKGLADIMNISLTDLMCELFRLCKGSGYIFCGWEQISELIGLIRKQNLSNRLCCWRKTNPSPMNGDVIWLSGAEYCVYWKNPNAVFNEHCMGGVWDFPSGKSKKHPTEKPLKLFSYLVGVSSNKEQLVLDPFMGSGTTGVACKELGRNFIGIEICEKYFNIAKRRIENTTQDMFVGINGPNP